MFLFSFSKLKLPLTVSRLITSLYVKTGAGLAVKVSQKCGSRHGCFQLCFDLFENIVAGYRVKIGCQRAER
jgi:hypothetical protein